MKGDETSKKMEEGSSFELTRKASEKNSISVGRATWNRWKEEPERRFRREL